MQLLTQEEINEQAANLAAHWHVHEDKISCQLKFEDFIAAFAFMTAVALEVEKINHHPTWSNTYNTLEIELSTHDAGGLTALDFNLARKIDKHFTKPDS